MNDSQNDDQAAMVTVEYKIDAQDVNRFTSLMQTFAKERMRDGATRWDLTQNVESPEIWIEMFHLPSWAEHLEQHERATNSDIALQKQIKELDGHDGGPIVRHYLKPI